MILLRRNLAVLSQEEIGQFLGLVVSEKDKHLFSDRIKSGERPKAGYGTQISKEKYSLNKFFNREGIPLQAKKIEEIEGSKVQKAIEENLKKGNDIIALHHNKIIDKNGKDCGHACLISKISGNKLTFVDPSPETKKEYSVGLDRLLYAMTDKCDGNKRALWVIFGKE